MKKKNIIGKIKFIVLLLIALTQLFPLYWLITFSLKSNTEIFGENVIGLPKVWRWDNYITALSSSNLIRYFLNSVFYSVVTVVVAGIISSMAAYAIARMTWKLKNAVYGLFMIGIMIPAQAALLPLFQILDKLGIKGGYLGLIIPYIAGALPMSIMILVGFYRGIPREMEEAAYIDGCGIFKCFIQIIFPMVKPAIATASIFTFLGTWNELMLANTFVDSDQYRTLPVGMDFSNKVMIELTKFEKKFKKSDTFHIAKFEDENISHYYFEFFRFLGKLYSRDCFFLNNLMFL